MGLTGSLWPKDARLGTLDAKLEGIGRATAVLGRVSDDRATTASTSCEEAAMKARAELVHSTP